MSTFEVTYLDRLNQPGSLVILAESEADAVAIVGRWETCFTNIRATPCNEVDYVK